jgi:hypothetical protein
MPSWWAQPRDRRHSQFGPGHRRSPYTTGRALAATRWLQRSRQSEVGVCKAVLAVIIALPAARPLLVIREGAWPQDLVDGGTLALVGLPFLVLSRSPLGKAWSVAPKATTPVTHVLHARIPDPTHTFLDQALVGVIVAARQPWLVAA